MLKPKLPKKRWMQTHFAEEASREQYDAVVVFGGDGTVTKSFQVLMRETTSQVRDYPRRYG